MKKAIVTGAGGFLGGAITRKLLEEDVVVYGVTSHEGNIEKFKAYENFIPIVAGFQGYIDLPQIIADSDVDVLFHCAWVGTTSKEYQDYDVQIENLNVVSQLVQLLVKTGCKKCVFISSAYQNKVLPLNNQQYNDNIYGIIKESCEKLLKLGCVKNNIGFNAVVFTTLYGVGDTTNRLVNSLILKAINNETPMLVQGEHPYDFLYIDDAVNGIMAIYNKGHDLKQYYIGARKLRAFKEYILDLFQCINPNVELEFGEYQDDSYIDYSKMNLEELYMDTGFECGNDYKESIIKTAEWLSGRKQYE